ncbi:hypothetical protein [Okeania sp. SIO2C2]|nr:hypothetical protein [Okeania sp. SIO2C2]
MLKKVSMGRWGATPNPTHPRPSQEGSQEAKVGRWGDVQQLIINN